MISMSAPLWAICIVLFSLLFIVRDIGSIQCGQYVFEYLLLSEVSMSVHTLVLGFFFLS